MKLSFVGQFIQFAFVQLVSQAIFGVNAVTLNQKARSFLELRAENLAKATAKDGPLFPVSVSYDWKTHDPKLGVSILMWRGMGRLKMVAGISTSGDAVAWGYMKDDLSDDGWIKLFLETTDSVSVSNDVKMYAAGYIEGVLTAARISQFYANFYGTLMKDQNTATAMQSVKKVFLDEIEFVKTNTNFHPGAVAIEPLDPYWKHMRYQFVQLWAVKDGYNFVALSKQRRQLALLDFMIINTHAELPELVQAYTLPAMERRRAFQEQPQSFLQAKLRGGRPPAKAASADFRLATNASKEELDRDWEERLIKRGHCSALVRLAPENADLLIGHTTWGDYAKMTRIFKYYRFDLPGAYTKANVIGFSSYPGCISSTDDFYILDSGLVIMDTSLEILNMELYNRIQEFPANSHVPDFMHIMVANRMASTAAHWGVLFSTRNSGTDNAQWMIVDYNRFRPKKPMADGTLWIVEQVPGLIFKKDMTSYLQDNGYWASYNRPYFQRIREMTGHTDAEAKFGALYSYAENPRASIFKSVAPLSSHLMDMRSIMNRNMFPAEGVLPSSPGHAISARMDLAFSKIPNGGIDAKVLNRCLLRSMQCQAISGPSHDNQAIFKWADNGVDRMPGWPHLGLPDVWDFDWVQMSPTAQLPRLVDVAECNSGDS